MREGERGTEKVKEERESQLREGNRKEREMEKASSWEEESQGKEEGEGK